MDLIIAFLIGAIVSGVFGDDLPDCFTYSAGLDVGDGISGQWGRVYSSEDHVYELGTISLSQEQVPYRGLSWVMKADGGEGEMLALCNQPSPTDCDGTSQTPGKWYIVPDNIHGDDDDGRVSSDCDCRAVLLSGFYYSVYNGVWEQLPDFGENLATWHGAPIYLRVVPNGRRFLSKWKFGTQSGWGIGNDYTDRWYWMWKLGGDLYGDCDYGNQCLDWHYSKSGSGWLKTPSHTEKIKCYNVDAAAPNPIANYPLIDEGELKELEASDFSEDSKSFDDFLPMIVGAAVGVLVIASIVVFVAAMKRKTAAKETAIEACDTVHVPDASAMQEDTPNVEPVAEETATTERVPDVDVGAVTAE